MKRLDLILSHPLFTEGIYKNKELEQDRKFCRHDMEHFLSVARLAYIFNLERKYNLPKDVIYAAALLHDIGRWKQYSCGIPHEVASRDMAEIILKDSRFRDEEIELICQAISEHRITDHSKQLSMILYDADKISRNCYSCAVQEECNWNDEKKNLHITW